MVPFQINNQDRQDLYDDIAQALAPIFELSGEEILAYQATTIPGPVIDAILVELDFEQFDIDEAEKPTLLAALESAITALPIANMNNLQTVVGAVMAAHLEGDSLQAFAKVVEGGFKKILVPRQIALAVSEPVADRVEGWLQRLVAGLRAQNIPTSFTAPSFLGQELDLQVDEVEVREVVYAPDQE